MEEFRIVLADACKIVKESSRKRVISGADEDGCVMVEFSEPVGGRRVKMLTPDEINGMLYKEERRKKFSANMGSRYSLSDEYADNGEAFVKNEKGGTNLIEIPHEIFDRLGISPLPFKLTESMALHVYSHHAKELKLKTLDDAIDFVLSTIGNADHVRLGRDNSYVFSVENGKDRVGKRAITIVIGDNAGEFIGIRTSGYESIKKLKERPLLWERSAKAASEDVATPTITTIESLNDDETSSRTKSQSNGSSASKVSESSETKQEKAEKSISAKVKEASADVNTEPTEAQKEAGNYKKGHVQVGAFDITIEQPEGSIRRGTDADGKQWESKMHNTYGYFRGTEGVDGDHIDVFLSNDIDGWNGAQVYVVDQYNPDGTFDEHKVMLGFNDMDEAKGDYLANYEQGWENDRRIDITGVNLEDFEKWIASSHRKTKPFSEYKSVKPADDSETFKGHKVENSGKEALEDVIGRSLNADETHRLIAFMENTAESAPELELTPQNWAKEFGESGVVSTPIGEVKQGDNQYLKLAQQGRNGKLGMIKPTLEHPSVIIEDERASRDGNTERGTSYVFIKTFVKKDGSRYYHFASITVSKEGKEVVISSQERSTNRISKLLQQGKVTWIDREFSLHPTAQIEKSVPLNDSNKPTSTDSQPALLGINSSELNASEGAQKRTTSTGKVSKSPETKQEKNEKSEEPKSEEGNGVDNAKIDAVLEALDKGKEKAARRLASKLTNKELSKARSKAKPSFLLEYEWQWRAQNRGDVSLHDWMLENQYVEPVKRVSGTFRITDYTAPKDSPYAERLGGVFHDNSGFAVATDGRILVADKGSYDPKLKGKIIGKDGAAMENKFPNWQKVIPFAEKTKSSRIDAEDLHRFVAGVLKANKRAYISLRFPDGTVEVFKANRLNLMLRAMKQLGTSELLYTKDGMELVAKSEKGTALLMGLVSVEDELVEANGYAYPGNTVSYHRGEVVSEMSQEERVLRDAVIDRLRESGMEVITDEGTGQRVLDEANGKVRQMSFGEPYDYAAYPYGRVEPNLAEKEVNVVAADANHGFNNYKEAKTWAKQNVSKSYNDKETGGKGNVRISNAAIDKFLSQSAVDKSDSKDVHMAVLKVLPGLLKTSIDVETHPDFIKGEDGKRNAENGINKDALVHRCYGAVSLDGKLYRVKITLKEDPRDLSFPHVTHSYEATKIELFAGTWENRKSPSPNTSSSITAAKLLENVGMSYNPGEKVLAASEKRSANIREQRVYHGSGADFETFDHSHMGEGEGSQAFGWGTYVTNSKDIGFYYATRIDNDPSKRSNLFQHSNGTRFKKKYPTLESFLQDTKRMAINGKVTEQEKIDYYHKMMKLAEPYHNLYAVEIPEDNGKNYLDWDSRVGARVLSKVNRQLEKQGKRPINPELSKRYKFLDGNDLYRALSIRMPNDDATFNDDKAASEFLYSLGFVGIKYKAGRNFGDAKEGATNYVIFNEKDAKITDHVRFFRTADGEAYGFTVGGKIYIDPKIANTETPIHEYAHLWAAALRGQNPKEWQNIVELMKGTSVWDEVKKRYPELNTDDDIADEVLATYSGRRGAERLREEQRKIAGDKGGVFEKAEAISALERVKQALRKFWKSVADFLHIHYKSAEEVADRVMKDLLDGVDPGKHFNSRNDDPRFMFAGEKGAARADRVMKDLFDDEGKNMRMESRDTDKEEVNIVEATHEHGFKNYADAKQWAKENIAGTYTDAETGGKGEIRISNTAIDKFLSESATAKSENRDAHMSTLRVLPDVIRESIDAEQHPDFKKGVDGKRSAENGVNSDVMIHRLYGAIRIGDDIYRVKVTLKENRRTKETTKAYSYETTKIELLAGQHGDVTVTSPRNSNNSISVANLLKGVEKSDGSGKILSEDNSEENKIIAEAKKNGRYMLAPNGKKSNLNERQWAQVRTKAFKNWFGDWESDPENASKVVDENGEPLVVDEVFLNLKESPLPKMKKAFSRAKELAEMGRKAEKDSGYQRNSTSFAYSEEGDAFLEEYMHSSDSVQALCDCLMDGYTPKPVVAFRYGEIRENQRSYNYRDNILEKGVSVVGKVSEMNTKKSGYYDAFFGGSDYNIVIGYDINESGADGEMLLTKANVIGKAKDMARIVKSATENSGKFSNEEDDIRYRTGEKKELRDGRKIEFVRKPTATYNALARHLQAEGIKPDMHEARTGSRYMSFEKDGVQWEVRSSDHTKPEYYGEAQKPVELTYYKDKQGEENLSVSVDLGTSGYNIEDVKALMAEIDRLKNDAGEVKESFDRGVASDEVVERYPLLSQALGVKSENEVRAKEEAREHTEEARKQEMRSAVEDMAGKLHLNNVDIVDKPAGRGSGRRERAKGMFERSTGRITINIGNCAYKRDAVVTLLHEAVAHHGLRKLFGENFETFLDNVYNSANAEIRRIIDKHSRRYGGDKRTAAEEYMASLAERTDFENAKKSGWWQRIKDFFLKMLEKIGLKGFKGEDLSDNELRYVLWRSYENLKSGGKDTVFSAADDLAKQSELNVGEFAPDAKAEGSVAALNTRFNNELQQQIDGNLPNNHIYQMGNPGKILLSTGVPDLPIQMNASRLKAKATSFGHDFNLGEVKNLVKALQEPLAVFVYGDKTKAQNIIVPLQKGGKNFIVGLSLNPTVGGRSLEINSIRNVFPKNNSEWLNWISQGKALYMDKEKIQALIDQQRTILADVEYLDLDSAAKVVENFENPKSESENDALFRDGDAKDYEKAQPRETYEYRVSTGMF